MSTYLDQMDSDVTDAITKEGNSVLFIDLMEKNASLRNYIMMLSRGHSKHMIEETDQLVAQIETVIATIDWEVE